MKRKRRTFTAKAKIALEAMKGEKTVNEIAQLYEVHPNQVSQLKGEMIANASAPFEKGKRAAEHAERSERKQEKLYKKIGDLSMDVEFLKKSRKRVRRLMREMGIEAICPKPSTSKPHPRHKVYPYLLRNVAIDRVDQVWCSVKYEDVYLKGYEEMVQLKRGLKAYFEFYNNRRRHSSLDGKTPAEVYKCEKKEKMAA